MYVDGVQVETVVRPPPLSPCSYFLYHYPPSPQGEFVDEGAENHFTISSCPVHIKTIPSGHKRKGLLYKLVLNGGEELDPVVEVTAE